MIRTKFVAILIGPVGIGLVGTFQAVQTLVSTFSGFGIQSSAVRDVSASLAEGDERRVGESVLTIRRMALLTGFFGAALMVILAVPASRLTFGTDEFAPELAMLGGVIMAGHIQGGQMALIQGMRRISDLARLNVYSAVSGTVVAVAIYAGWGMSGIVPALLSLAFIGLFWSWFFARRISVPEVSMSWRESFIAAGGMVRLGLAFMWSGLLLAGVAYATRALITQELSLAAVGIFMAAFTLSGLFVNFILQAMAADYYPRLTAVAEDHDGVNRLVNEQTEIGILLAVPGLLVMLSLAPWVIRIFYTSEFLPAAELLQWFILGCFGRVITWPMGFIMLALGKGGWFAATETLMNAIHILMIWAGLLVIGLEGVAIAFFGLYVVYAFVVFIVAQRLTAFSWSKGVQKLLLGTLPVVVIVFLIGRTLPVTFATAIGVLVSALASVVCMRELVSRIGIDNPIIQALFRIPGMHRVLG